MSLSNDELRKIAEIQRIEHAKYLKENRKVPLSKDAKPKCIVCAKILERESMTPKSEIIEAHKDNWEYATVDIIIPGWGSRYDMTEILIGVCDDCIQKCIEDGRIVWTFDSLGP